MITYSRKQVTTAYNNCASNCQCPPNQNKSANSPSLHIWHEDGAQQLYPITTTTALAVPFHTEQKILDQPRFKYHFRNASIGFHFTFLMQSAIFPPYIRKHYTHNAQFPQRDQERALSATLPLFTAFMSPAVPATTHHGATEELLDWDKLSCSLDCLA